MKDKDWEFLCGDWKEAFETAHSPDWIYLDSPYIGRDTSYVGEWPDFEAELLRTTRIKRPPQYVYQHGKKMNFEKTRI